MATKVFRLFEAPSGCSSHASAEFGPYWGYMLLNKEGFYEVLVPDLEDAGAAGETKDEALAETIKKLSSQLQQLPPSEIPEPSDEATATLKACAFVDADAGEFIHVVSWEMVQVPVDFSQVVELSTAELKELYKEYWS
ncbi:hypothetical protein GPECTOR_3g503 [Gonium pectorale]|uniref:Uncharacterized protein n=1 Tax=Gonium pectorale TaxID=33097 RepID=A0A150GZN2_GONPE|nr:hypothetical protein GPECTOR_3g503 [Gonium pectorale]|eukprot:KXZ55376.1 hypothetical protein GPECTOR_3g503 [Gonium pectorale]